MNPSKRMGPKMIALENLRPHPLNANVLPDDLLAKLKAHIKGTGRYPHIIVRPHPEEARAFQIIDGHHRVEVLRELGHSEARCDIWVIDDRETRLLLATLNRLEGQDVPIRRAQLVHELLSEMNLGDLAGLLPETDKQLEELEALLQFPAEEVAALLAEQAEEDEKVLPRVLTYVVSPEQEELIERAVELASGGTAGRDRKAKGLVNLARNFLEVRDAEVLEEQA